MSDGPAALGEEQHRQAGGDHGIVFRVAGPYPIALADAGGLLADEEIGALAIPVVAADEPPRGHPPDALHAVEVIEHQSCSRGAPGLLETLKFRPSQSIARSISSLATPPCPQHWT